MKSIKGRMVFIVTISKSINGRLVFVVNSIDENPFLACSLACRDFLQVDYNPILADQFL